MFHKVKSVKSLENYILEIVFQNNIIKYYDVSNLFEKWNVFKNLETVNGLFNQVKVDKGGYGISWNEDIDLSCDELWNNGYNK
jgi:hypothetical protein